MQQIICDDGCNVNNYISTNLQNNTKDVSLSAKNIQLENTIVCLHLLRLRGDPKDEILLLSVSLYSTLVFQLLANYGTLELTLRQLVGSLKGPLSQSRTTIWSIVIISN